MAKPRCSYQLHLQLQDTKPAVWRRVVVADTMTLAQLHRTLQASMGWAPSAQFAFDIAGQRYGLPDPDQPDDPTMDGRRYTLGQLLQGQSLPMRYAHALGSGWVHRLRLEICTPVDETAYPELPVCVDGRGACPPINTGGPAAYADFLAAWSDPLHPQHRAAHVRVGSSWDAKVCNVAAAQARIQSVQPPAAPATLGGMPIGKPLRAAVSRPPHTVAAVKPVAAAIARSAKARAASYDTAAR